VRRAGIDGEQFATIERALDERTIGHNPERLNLMKVTNPKPH
jgi:starch synthase